MIVTQAHDVGCGGVTWLSWNGQGGKFQQHPSFGSQLLAVTAQVAPTLLERMRQDEPAHFDLWLKRCFRVEPLAHAVKAAYVYPSIGSYDEHWSGSDPRVGVRQAQLR